MYLVPGTGTWYLVQLHKLIGKVNQAQKGHADTHEVDSKLTSKQTFILIIPRKFRDNTTMTKRANNILALAPLVPGFYLALSLLDNPFSTVLRWITNLSKQREVAPEIPPISSQLLAYILIGVAGYWMTNKLVPNIKQYTLRKGICGKDLGKRGTSIADKDVPEALGIVPGAVFLVCLIFCLVGYATSHPGKVNKYV